MILGLDSSTNAASVALVANEELITEIFLNVDSSHSQRLLFLVEILLKETGVSWEEIQGLGVAVGPGSFTALRIGISTIKGLAFAAQKPVATISTLNALAHNFSFASSLICPILDAKKKQVYAAIYRGQDGILQQVLPEVMLPPEELLTRINEKVIFVGSGVSPYKKLIKKVLGRRAVIPPKEMHYPRAAVVAMLAAGKIRHAETFDAATVKPRLKLPTINDCEAYFYDKNSH